MKKSYYVKAKLDNQPEKRKCRICGNRDETFNHTLNEWGTKVQQKVIQELARLGGKVYSFRIV